MVIDRGDRMINVCEMKYAPDDYSFSAGEKEKMLRRIELFRSATGTGKGILPTLVTTCGLKHNIDSFLAKRMFGGKTIVIYGPRQAGKTTAVEAYLSANASPSDVITFNGDETQDRQVLADASAETL